MPRNKRESGFTARLEQTKQPTFRSRTVVVRLSASLHDRLKAAAEKADVTVSTFVRTAIVHGIEQVE